MHSTTVFEKLKLNFNQVTCTHVVADEFESEDVKVAMKDEKRCVSILWLDWVLETRKMRPPRCLLHVPIPASGKRIDFGMKDRFRVSISHFPPKTNEYVKAGLSRLGVVITKMLYKDTDLLIVPKPVGDKYTTAIRFNTPCVNLTWLRDALLKNKVSLKT